MGSDGNSEFSTSLLLMIVTLNPEPRFRVQGLGLNTERN